MKSTVKLRRGPAYNEMTVLFDGNPIGSVKRFEYDGPSNGLKLRWFAHTFDGNDHIGYGFRLQNFAVNKVVHLFTEAAKTPSGYRKPGDISTAAKLWIGRVSRRLEGDSK